MDTTFRVVLTGGGSGGHIYPLLAVAEALQKKSAELGFKEELTYIGPADSYAPLFAAKHIAVQTILSGKLRRYASLENIVDIPKFFLGLIQAFWKMYFLMPDAVFSKGGPGALPVVIAAWFYNIPVAIHESDAIPGLTNTISARFAKKIFVSFPEVAEKFNEKKVLITGAPIRTELLENRTSQALAKESLGFSSSTPLILILGGSQGALRINNFILSNLPGILGETQVLHQTGVAHFLEAQKLSRAALIDQAATQNRYVPINYFTDNLSAAYIAADIVVGRPGAGMIFETASFGKPAILIPLPESANNHQRANAYAFSEIGGGIVMEEDNLLPGIFINQLHTLLTNQDLYVKMAAASTHFFIPDAAEKIVEEIMKMGT